jgi:hypothetical protein
LVAVTWPSWNWGSRLLLSIRNTSNQMLALELKQDADLAIVRMMAE